MWNSARCDLLNCPRALWGWVLSENREKLRNRGALGRPLPRGRGRNPHQKSVFGLLAIFGQSIFWPIRRFGQHVLCVLCVCCVCVVCVLCCAVLCIVCCVLQAAAAFTRQAENSKRPHLTPPDHQNSTRRPLSENGAGEENKKAAKFWALHPSSQMSLRPSDFCYLGQCYLANVT